MLINLNRFGLNYETFQREKFNNFVDIPNEINMKEFMGELD